MNTRYKLRSSEDFNGAPLLIMTLQTERDIALTGANISELLEAVRLNVEGPNAISEEELEIWLSALQSSKFIIDAADNRDAFPVNLSSDWLPIPSTSIEKILADYQLKADSDIRIYSEGSVHNIGLVFQAGANSAKFNVSKETLPAITSDFENIKKIVEDGKASGVTSEKINYTLDQAFNTGVIVTAAGACAAGIVGALGSAGMTVVATIGSCIAWAKATKDAIDRANKEASDRAEKQKMDRDFSRANSGGDGRVIAGEPRGFSGGDRINS